MAKPDGKVFTPARNFLGTRTPAVAVAAVATAATVTTTATNIDVAEEDVVLGSMHKGKFYLQYLFNPFKKFSISKSLQANWRLFFLKSYVALCAKNPAAT